MLCFWRRGQKHYFAIRNLKHIRKHVHNFNEFVYEYIRRNCDFFPVGESSFLARVCESALWTYCLLHRQVHDRYACADNLALVAATHSLLGDWILGWIRKIPHDVSRYWTTLLSWCWLWSFYKCKCWGYYSCYEYCSYFANANDIVRWSLSKHQYIISLVILALVVIACQILLPGDVHRRMG